MRRLIPIFAAALVLGAAIPATASAAETKVLRGGSAVGSLVPTGGSRYNVQNLDYTVEGEVRRVGQRRHEFHNRFGRFGWVVRVGPRWDVYSSSHPSDRIGYVMRVGKRRYAAYNNGTGRVGDAFGQAALQGAASVLLVFHG